MPRSLKSLNSSSQQLQNFTNRESELEVLRRVLDLAEGHPLPVVMFWGVGGNGKSWLLRKLREGLPPGLPAALLDLDPMTGGTPYHADSARALAELRHQLAAVAFPRFDLAYAWLRYKEGVKDEPLLRGSGAAAKVFEFITEVVPSILEGIPLVGWSLKQVAGRATKRLKGTPLERWLAGKVGQDDFQHLRKATSQDVYRELTDRFLQDAAENLPPRAGKACRGIVFLDTFEALRVGVQGEAQSGYREEWVRNLHATDSPLLLVLTGRDQLRWHEIDPGYADAACLEQHLIGGLSEGHARDFLGKCGITDRPLQEAVLRVSADSQAAGAAGEPAYHPFSLGLCADAVLAETAGGGTVDPMTFDMPPGDTGRLAQRFLRSLNDPAHEVWVKRLALTPRFDEAAARAMFSPVPGAAQDAAWQALLGYSFVRVTDDPGWWTFHARMSDALAERSSAPEGHPLWEEYWRERSQAETDDFAALSWYHHFCLTPDAARDEWDALAEQRRKECRMAEHYGLLSWWEPTGVMATTVLTPGLAAYLVSLGVEYEKASLGNPSDNIHRAVECFTLALRVYTEADFPEEWAGIQDELGTAYCHLPTGDREENLQRAIACFEAALRVYSEADFPEEWAGIQYGLSATYWRLSVRDQGENLRRAITCCEAALRVYTEADSPQGWACIQGFLGRVYQELPDGDLTENLRRAITSCEAALRVFTEAESPQGWAWIQEILGRVYVRLPGGDQGENLRRAIASCEAALRVYTETDFPRDWATTQYNLGDVYHHLPGGDRGDNLRRAIVCYEAALRVYTEIDFPREWATIYYSLGGSYGALSEVDRGENLPRAIACCEAALRVFTEVTFPRDWALTQNILGASYGDLPTGDREENLRRAIAGFEAGLRVFTEGDSPRDWALTQHNLGIMYRNLPTGDRGENLRRAFLCFTAALRVCTEAALPQNWASIQHSLGVVYRELPAEDRRKNLSRAIACFEDALRVRTEVGFPSEWAKTQHELGVAYLARLRVEDNPLDLERALSCLEGAERGFRKVEMLVEAENSRGQADDVRRRLGSAGSSIEG